MPTTGLGRLAGLRLELANVVVGAGDRLRNVGDGGVVVSKLLLDRRARRYDSIASAGLPVSATADADAVVGERQVRYEIR